jgi:hypothetical protein
LFTVIPAITNSTTSILDELVQVNLATVDVEETHLVIAMDVFGNAQDDFNDNFVVSLTHSDLETVVAGVVTETATVSEY